MRANTIRRGTLIGDARVLRTGYLIELGERKYVFHMSNGDRIVASVTDEIDVTRPGRIELHAAWIKRPTRTELVAGVKERQGGDYVGVVTTRRV